LFYVKFGTMPATGRSEAPWRRRLFLPNYQVQEAAKYAQIAPQTVIFWQRGGAGPALAERKSRMALSYMQLIEVAVVAALRKEGVPLRRIRDAREYLEKNLKSEFPFAEYRLKNDGQRLFMDFAQAVGPKRGRGKLLRPDQQGQLAWEAVIGRLREFEYETQRDSDSVARRRSRIGRDDRPPRFIWRSDGQRHTYLGDSGTVGRRRKPN
jgi:hypothetical protein